VPGQGYCRETDELEQWQNRDKQGKSKETPSKLCSNLYFTTVSKYLKTISEENGQKHSLMFV
jgi:hypothetical protein